MPLNFRSIVVVVGVYIGSKPGCSKIEHLTEKLPIDRILKDVRQVNAIEPQRINITNPNDIYYLNRNDNVNKIRHPIVPLMRNVEMGENSVIKSENEKISQILLENHIDTTSQQMDEKMIKKTIWDNLTDVVFTLDPDEFVRLTNKFYEMAEGELAKNEPTNKRKMEKQTYFSTNKRTKVIIQIKLDYNCFFNL